MDWAAYSQRQAVADWRDTQMLEAQRLLNDRCREALEAFENQLSTASLIDAFWDPAGFSVPRIDELLRYRVPGRVEQLLREAGEQLLAIDERFRPLAEALGERNALLFPREDKRETLPIVVPQPHIEHPAPPAASWRDYLPEALQQPSRALSDKLAEAVARHSSDLSRILSDKVLRYSRLRQAALERVATRWLGETGEPRPVLAQVLTILDDIALEARMKLT